MNRLRALLALPRHPGIRALFRARDLRQRRFDRGAMYA